MKPEEARKWAELYTAIADGKKWQIENLKPAGSGRRWRDANEHDDPRGWRVEHLRVKPEPQKVYVATWFEDDGRVNSCSLPAFGFDDVCHALQKACGGGNGFVIHPPIERELP